MPEQQTLSLLFYRGSGIPALMVRYACRFPCQPFGTVAGHTAVRIGDDVYEAVITGVQRTTYCHAAKRADLIRECPMPQRTPRQIAAARAYAEKCLKDGERYSWTDIQLIVWAWAAPSVVASFPNRFAKSQKGTICSLFAMLVAVHGGCKMAHFFSPSTTPNELMIRSEDYAAALGPEIQACMELAAEQTSAA